jgi:hypothetical protein
MTQILETHPLLYGVWCLAVGGCEREGLHEIT